MTLLKRSLLIPFIGLFALIYMPAHASYWRALEFAKQRDRIDNATLDDRLQAQKEVSASGCKDRPSDGDYKGTTIKEFILYYDSKYKNYAYWSQAGYGRYGYGGEDLLSSFF